MAKKVGELGAQLRTEYWAETRGDLAVIWRAALGGEPRSQTSCRSPQGVPGSFPWPTIPQHYDEFHDIFRRRSLFSQQPTLPRPSVPCGIPFTLIIRNFSKTNISQCTLPSYISN